MASSAVMRLVCPKVLWDRGIHQWKLMVEGIEMAMEGEKWAG